MKTSDLIKAAEVAKETASKDSPLAYLSAGSGRLHIKATDRANWLSVSTECAESLDSIQVPADKLLEVARSVRTDEVRLSVKDGALLVKSKGGQRSIRLQPSPYPDVGDVEGMSFTIPASRLNACLAFCRPAVGDDSARVMLMGIHIHRWGSEYRTAAFDGQVLCSIAMCAGGDDVAVSILPPTAGLLRYIPEDAEVTVTTNNRRISFRWDGGMIVANGLEAEFISYMDKIPAHEGALAVRGEEMIAACRSASTLADDEKQAGSRRLWLSLGSEVRAWAKSPKGEADELLDAEWAGEPFNVHFALRRIEQALPGFGSDELNIGITKVPEDGRGGKAMLVRSVNRDDRFALIMPLRG